jgi:hypothetical protein
MTIVQFYLAVGLPLVVNAAMFGLLVMYMNGRFDSFERRFDDMRDLWRADARLKHIEGERR